MALRKRSFIVLGFGALGLLAACGGKIVDIGGQSTSQQITPSAVTVATNQCASGYEHSNICCTGGSSTSTPTCESWPDAPFHPCPDGWTTYPNAAECCSLDNPSDCSTCGGDTGNVTPPSTGVSNGPNQPVGDPTTSACGGATTLPEPYDGGPYTGDAGPPPVPTSCDPRCPPGYTGISPYDPQGCCTYDSSGAGICFGEARAGSDGFADGGLVDASTDAGPAPDAGVNPGGPEIDAGDPTPIGGVCDISCPDGWILADAADGVCCNNGANGDEECFALPFPDDNGGAGGVSVGSDGTNGSGPPQTIDAGSAPSH